MPTAAPSRSSHSPFSRRPRASPCKGTLSPEQVADLTVSARALDNAGGKTSAGQVAIGKLAFDASVKGPILRPRIDAKLDAADVDAPQGKLKTLTAHFATTPADNAAKTAPIPFTAHAQATGVAATDPALARALGTSFTLDAAGSANNGVADVQNARLKTSTAEIAFTGRIGQPELHGRLTVHASDLTRFGDLAGLKLAGVLDLSASLSGVPKDGRIEAVLDGRADKFATGIAAIDGLTGGRLTLNGTIRKLPHGGYGFGNLRLVGRHASARADGEATADGAGINVQLAIPELKYADKRLTGAASGKLRLTGSVLKPDADIDITVTNGSALGRPIPRLTLAATATDLTGQLAAKAKLSGSVGGKPADGTLDLAKRAQGGWHLSNLDLRVGSVTAKGALTLNADDLAAGRLTIDARDLDDISPLVLTKLSGALHADTTLAVTDGGQSATLSAQAHAIKIGAWRLDRLDTDMRVSDLYRRPIVDGHMSLDRARFGGEDISQIRLNAKAAGTASAITLTARARGFAIDARGKLHAASPVRLDLAAFDARRGKHRIALAHPTTLIFRDGGVEAKSLLLALDRGRLAVDGRLGKTLDVSLKAQSVPLSVSETVMPKLGLSGILERRRQDRWHGQGTDRHLAAAHRPACDATDAHEWPAADHHCRFRTARQSPHQPRRHHPRRRRRHAHRQGHGAAQRRRPRPDLARADRSRRRQPDLVRERAPAHRQGAHRHAPARQPGAAEGRRHRDHQRRRLSGRQPRRALETHRTAG